MVHLSAHTQVIKHNNFIKTEGRLRPIAAEAVVQTGVICYPLTTMIPHFITRCTKSCGPLKGPKKGDRMGESYFNKSPTKLNHKCQVQESNYRRSALAPFLLFLLSLPPLPYFITMFFVFLASSFNTSPPLAPSPFPHPSPPACVKATPPQYFTFN